MRCRSTRFVWLWAWLSLAAVSLPAVAQARESRLASDGRAVLPIVVVDPTGDFEEAFLVGPSLQDLTRTLDQITGGAFERKIVQRVQRGAPPAIYVGLAEQMGALGVPQDLEDDACVVRTTGNGGLVLSGPDPRGVSHAIYRLLHQLGCRWYYPGDEWAVTVSQPDLSVELELRVRPDFPIQRRIWIGHGLRGAPRPAFDDWQRRNCIAQPFDVATNHTWFGLDREKDFEMHPEWFAEVDGDRQPSKPSYAHPQVLERGIQHALTHFENNPDSKMISLSPPDGLGFDTSELAKQQAKVVETFEAHGTTFGLQADGTLVSLASENVFHFVNEVARAVQREHPGKLVGILAYSAYAQPPTFTIEPNVYVELTRGYRRTPLSSVEQIIAFSELADNLGIYEYYDVEQWSWERPGSARAAKLNYLQGSFRFYQRHSMRALSGEMSSNFGPYGVGYYVISQLLWDATQDVRKLERQFYERAFGPAADPVQRVYRRWESGRGLDDMALAATYRDLAEATRLAEGDPGCRKRINRLKLYAHFLKIYLQPKAHGSEADDVKAWVEQFGEEEIRRRVDALGTWVGRITDAHIVHGQAFNKFLRRRGEVLGIDVSQWDAKDVPSESEMESIFERDLADLSDIQVKPIPAAVYSQRLVPVAQAVASLSGRDQAAGWARGMRAGTAIVKLDAGQTAMFTFSEAGAEYTIAYLATNDFASGMDPQFAMPLAEGTAAADTLAVEAKEAGYYIIRLTGGKPSLEAISHAHVLPQNGLKLDTARLFFYVPKGTRHFILKAAAYKGPTVTLRGPAGNIVVEQAGYAVTKEETDESTLRTEWVIDVPSGADGAVWCVEGPGNVNRTSTVSLIGVPSHFALTAEQLLVPHDALR